MTKYQFTVSISQDEYDAFVRSNPNHNLLQSWNWAKVKSNWDSIITGVRDEQGHLVAAGLALIKGLPGGFGLMYLPRGPIMDFQDQELLSFYMDGLKKEAKKHKILFAKMDPAIKINTYRSAERNDDRFPETEAILNNMKNAGCIHQGYTTMIEESIQPRFVSVTPNTGHFEEELPKRTKKKIKEANKLEVTIKHGGKELLDEFSRIIHFTEEEKGISLRSRDYFEKLMDAYGDDAVIFIASTNVEKLRDEASEKAEQLQKQLENLPENANRKKQLVERDLETAKKRVVEYQAMLDEGIPAGEIGIAGQLNVRYGDVFEMLYAGMDRRFKRFRPQYKEYAEFFKYAFDQGCQEVNMGGVEGTLDDGLTEFKDNFSPFIYEYIGEFDLPVNAMLYKPAKIAYNKFKSRMNS